MTHKSDHISLIILILLLIILGVRLFTIPYPPEVNKIIQNRDSSQKPKRVFSPHAGMILEINKIKTQREKLNETIWAPEVLAQKYEDTFVRLWDELRNKKDKFSVLEYFRFEKILLGKPQKKQVHDWGIQVTKYTGSNRSLNPEQWAELLHELKSKGYQIIQTEWHHSKFETLPNHQRQSIVSMVLHVSSEVENKKWDIRGELKIQWTHQKDNYGNYIVQIIDASNIEIMEWNSSPIFKEVLNVEFPGHGFVHVWDLTRDGLPEIIIPESNLFYLNLGNMKFKKFEFIKHLTLPVKGGVFADLTGDGNTDFLCAVGQENYELLLYQGNEFGQFLRPGENITEKNLTLSMPKSFTVGDIDGDGDLDLWVGQYKPPYLQGQMPTPYYNANDGFPAYLLLNEGRGNFSDITEKAGLSAKRYRRTFSSSFIDLDEDGDLDLLVVNDFAGIDIYYNDGTGQFTDVTEEIVYETSTFGMSHTFGDYNLDGALDFFVIGMSSTTSRRLDALNLGREEFPDYQKMRKRISYGNRMYIKGNQQVFHQPSFGDQLARSGWSWGSTSFDFDNDGDLDIYVANGHSSVKTAKDYCTTFWTHDIYSGSSKPDFALQCFFEDNYDNTMSEGISWNGFEHNHLFMNESGNDFMNVAFLTGTAFEDDSRTVISNDLNADGKPDLLYVGSRDSNQRLWRLHVLENVWPESNNWIGICLQETAHSVLFGAKITLSYAPGKQIARIVTGDSYRAQHASIVHFGLGKENKVDIIEVQWPNGIVKVITNPQINQYHNLQPDHIPITHKTTKKPSG